MYGKRDKDKNTIGPGRGKESNNTNFEIFEAKIDNKILTEIREIQLKWEKE